MRRVWPGAAVLALFLVAMSPTTEAHKPITSPFTYSADVQPILRERCGRCHIPGGVAPMSLLTYQDAVPWGESMRAELSAGHMPPWRVDRGSARVQGAESLTARELNVLLTWAAGGTPPGDIAAEPLPSPATPLWPLGPPDAILDLPAFTLGADEQERTGDFTLPAADTDRALRAIDLQPGTPAIVRSANIAVEVAGATLPLRDERMLALWVPGDDPLPLGRGALRIPAAAKLAVRVRYRKTWSYEGKALTDRSRVGLYFASAAAPTVRAVTVSNRPVTLPETLRAVAAYPDGNFDDAGVILVVTTPGGRQQELIAFHPRPGWMRRFWFAEPVTLPRGTSLSVRVVKGPPSLLPAGPGPGQGSQVPPVAASVTVNVVS
jgi:hypothetical protein